MKGYFKSLKTVVKVNSSGGFECPSCSLSGAQAPAKLYLMNDKIFKKYKFYIKCKWCKRTTPAFENLKNVVDNWEDLFISKELEICQC